MEWFLFTVYNWSNLTVTVSFPSKQVRHSIWGTVTRYNWYAILWLLTSLLGGYGIPTERELPRTWSLYSGLHHGYAWWRVYGRGFNIVSFPGNSPVNLLTYQFVSLQTHSVTVIVSNHQPACWLSSFWLKAVYLPRDTLIIRPIEVPSARPINHYIDEVQSSSGSYIQANVCSFCTVCVIL